MTRIPEGLSEALKPHLDENEPILLCASADRDGFTSFCDIVLAATPRRLCLLKGNVTREKTFRGFVDHGKKKTETTRDFASYEYSEYPLDTIENLEVINLVSGGELTATKNGASHALCAFTNARSKEIGRFVMLFNRLKNKGELTEEDYKSTEKQETCPKCGMIYPDPTHPVCPNCSKKSTTMLRILKLAMPYKWQMIAVYLLTIGGAGLSLLLPYLKGKTLYDGALTQGSAMEGKIGLVLLLVIGAMIVQLAMRVLANIINVNFSARLIYNIKTTAFRAMQKLSLSFFMDKQTGTLMTRINGDASGMHYFLVDGLSYIVSNVFVVVGATVMMLILDWKLMLLCYIPVMIIVFYLRRKFNILRKMNWRRFRRRSSLNSVISDTVKGTRVVKAFGREEAEIDRFGTINSNFRGIETAFNKQLSTLIPINSLIINAGGILVWAFGGAQILGYFGGGITYGTLMTFINCINMIYGPVQSLPDMVNWWSDCMTCAQRIFEIVDSPVDVPEPEHPVLRDTMKGDVSVRDMSFGYDINKYVLKHINFDIEAGTMVGIVGHSGAGKSTLVNLISRFYDVNDGVIEIDGVNVKDYPSDFLRKNIGIVSQEIFVFNGSVADNIAYAKPGCTRDEVVHAAKVANAHDFIQKLPDGYDTVIGQGGVDLSGGEKQRLSIARAILHDPKILILDEATANIDTQTELIIQKALSTLLRGRTSFIIAHRLSTIRNADRIMFISDQSIVESGTHEELLRAGGRYYELVQNQSAG